MIKRISITWIAILFAWINGTGQTTLLTTAEKSDYKSTSDYKDVTGFIDKLKQTSSYIRVETIGRSAGGMDIPLMIIGKPLPSSPSDLKNDGRVVIYIQANIHGGEVEGKEASLMFARDILKDKDPHLLDNVVLLICPLINPDGNEKISTLNRPHQNGPVNGVGVRYNDQFLDLNRDAMKAESPEVRGVLENVFNRWDPSVFMDCHTTNGSFHEEPVTFTWMVNPDGDNSLIAYMRDRMMPEISGTLSGSYKVANCFYGEFIDMMDLNKGWVMDASEPRYMVNYFGIRNRLGILNENYVYADFKTRVLGCYYLIHSLFDYAGNHSTEIRNLISSADRKTVNRGLTPSQADSFAIRYVVKPAAKMITIKAFEADMVTGPSGRMEYKKSDRQKTVTVPYFIDYSPVKSVKFPFAYLLTVNDPVVTRLLTIHGIRMERLAENSRIEIERFEISGLHGAPRLNQGHYTDTVEGNFINDTIDFPSGTIVIRTAQPLADVAAYLLEPETDDGLLTWNFLDRYLVPQWGRGFNPYPVYKILNAIPLKTIPLAE